MKYIYPFLTIVAAKMRPMNPMELEVERKANHPTVKSGGSCQEECLFKDLNNYWCLETVSPVLSAGWEWEQSAASTYWNI